jgi:hypothetical protein
VARVLVALANERYTRRRGGTQVGLNTLAVKD